MQEYNNLLVGFDGILKKIDQESNHFSHTKSVNRINSVLQEMMEKESKANHITIASYKNDLSQKLMQAQHMTQKFASNKDPLGSIETLINKVMKT